MTAMEQRLVHALARATGLLRTHALRLMDEDPETSGAAAAGGLLSEIADFVILLRECGIDAGESGRIALRCAEGNRDTRLHGCRTGDRRTGAGTGSGGNRPSEGRDVTGSGTMGRLHLLVRLHRHVNDQPYTFEQICGFLERWCAGGSEYATYLRYRPRREHELEGASGYFVWRGETRFRLPLRRIEPVPAFNPLAAPRWHRHVALVFGTCRVGVGRKSVRQLRGFRYLEAADAPSDLQEEGGNRNMPDRMQSNCRGWGSSHE